MFLHVVLHMLVGVSIKPFELFCKVYNDEIPLFQGFKGFLIIFSQAALLHFNHLLDFFLHLIIHDHTSHIFIFNLFFNKL